MLAELKPYPEYKDSGQPWLGVVPAHWQLRRAKYVLREIDRRWNDRTGQLLSVSQYTGVTKRQLRKGSDEPATRSETLEGYKIVTASDLAVNIMLAWNGSLGVSPFDGVVSPAYCVYRFHIGDPWYFHNLLRSPDYRAEIKRRSRGVVESRLRLYSDDLFRIPLLVPPSTEQATIVRFLGAVDRKVNRFIRAKRRLIEVLTEQKQAIITHAVTKGLNPHAKLKSSGIDWLGDVPAHWRTLRLGRTVDLVTGFPFPSSGFTHNAADIPLLRGVNVAPGSLRWNEVVRWPDVDSTLAPFHLRAGDVVLGMDRPVISTGVRVAVVRESDLPCLLLQRVCRLRAHDGLRQAYIPLLLTGRAFADYLAPIFTGISVPHISPEQICSFRVVLPPVEEQDRILEHVAAQTRDVDAVIERTEREIDLIREYRTRLVADVVTGKLDVRGFVPTEPMPADEPADEPIEEVGLEDEEAELVEEAVDAAD